jgi:hypothetical protein
MERFIVDVAQREGSGDDNADDDVDNNDDENKPVWPTWASSQGCERCRNIQPWTTVLLEVFQAGCVNSSS